MRGTRYPDPVGLPTGRSRKVRGPFASRSQGRWKTLPVEELRSPGGDLLGYQVRFPNGQLTGIYATPEAARRRAVRVTQGRSAG